MNLAERFGSHPSDRPAMIFQDRVTTYANLSDRAGRWHGALVDAGISAGDRVLIVGGNSDIFVLAYLACLSAGVVSVPVNPLAPPAEIRREIAAVDPVAVIVDSVGEAPWAAIDRDRPSSIAHAFVASEGRIDALEGGTSRFVADVDGDAPAVLLFTSGTAGTPRAAILTHDNLWASMRSVLSLDVPLLGEHHVALGVIPLFHVFGLNLIINLGLSIGATIVLEDHVSPNRTARLIRDHGVTVVSGPPNLWAALADDSSITAEDVATVKLAVSGAARLDPRIALRVEERLGIRIAEGYGLTETSGIVTSAIGIEAPLGSVGQMFPGLEVRIVDALGADALVGDAGEVWVRGPMVSPGYWNDPVASANARDAEGWLHTGDLAVVDERGNLAVVDRIKDLIIVSGFNVHPAEVEDALAAHPLVAAAGVFGLPDSVTGERIVAHVRLLNAPEHSEEAAATLRAYCQTQLARYKVPKDIVFVDMLPTGAIGKLRRNQLHGTSSQPGDPSDG